VAALPTIVWYVGEAAEEMLRGEQKAYAPALWSWTDASGTSPPQRIDLRIKGSITLRPWDDKPSLKIHFARHEERGPRSFRGAKKLTLHNLAYDPSAVREWLAYDLMRAAGQPAPRVGWAVVRINGVSKHLYALVESYDEVFLDDWFESTTALYEADGDLAGGLAGSCRAAKYAVVSSSTGATSVPGINRPPNSPNSGKSSMFLLSPTARPTVSRSRT